MRHNVFWIILGIAVCCDAGCGPKVVTVTGTVTYNGNPLNEEGCNIVFLGPDPDRKQVTAPVASNGKYEAIGVVAGPNRVAIYYRNPEAAKSREPGEKTPSSISLLRNLPPKYADVKTSELTFDPGTGTVFDVNMKGPPLDSPTPKTTAPKKQKENSGKGKPHKE